MNFAAFGLAVVSPVMKVASVDPTATARYAHDKYETVAFCDVVGKHVADTRAKQG